LPLQLATLLGCRAKLGNSCTSIVLREGGVSTMVLTKLSFDPKTTTLDLGFLYDKYTYNKWHCILLVVLK